MYITRTTEHNNYVPTAIILLGCGAAAFEMVIQFAFYRLLHSLRRSFDASTAMDLDIAEQVARTGQVRKTLQLLQLLFVHVANIDMDSLD